jgi:seryl-tRNA synthetase
MSYSYSNPVSYGPQYQQTQIQAQVQETRNNNGATTALVAGAAVGGIGGAITGTRVNPYIDKKGIVKDGFAEKVIKKYYKNASDNVKKWYAQSQEVLKKIGNIQNVEELKTLAREYSEAFKNTINLNNVSEQNLSQNINTIKENITTRLNTEAQNIKNQIQQCWNKDKKAFEKASGVSDDIYNVINKSTGGARFKNMLKFGGIGALALGTTGFILHKVISNRKAQQ